MKKLFKRIICAAVSLTTVLSAACAAACFGSNPSQSGNGGNGGSTITGNNVATEYVSTGKYTGGTHIFNVSSSNKEFVTNGASDYQVLIASGASGKIEAAASTFVKIFKEATGVDLPVVRDSAKTYSDSARYIVLGESEFVKGSGVQKPEGLKKNGYIIKTVGNSIITVGGGDLGTLFGAYGLLNQLFGYEMYFIDSFENECYYVETGVKNLKLPIFDVYDNPDFDHAIAGYAPMFTNSDQSHKMRMETQGEVFITGSGTSYVHNTLQYLPKSKYQEEHPKWYSTNNLQLCYTAYGDKEEYNKLIDELATVLIQAIKESPDKEIITLTHMDDGYWCECSNCRALKMQYGTDAAGCIMLTNDVADKIEAWRLENAPERKITLVMFAYSSTATPPAKKNDDGTWSAIDEKVKTRDNVCVYFAPLGNVSFNAFWGDEANEESEEILKGWCACSDHVSIWSYSSFFYDYFIPYDTFAANQSQYIRWLNAGGIWIFENSQYDTKASLCFSPLKAYLNSVWSWDVNKDYNELVDAFFANYFGSESGAMRKYYEELRVWMQSITQSGVHGITGSKHADWSVAEYWPENLLEKWLGYIEQAKKEVEPLKQSDPELYQLIIDRITQESLTPRYMLLQFHSTTHFSVNELAKAKSSFASDCRRLGVTRMAEGQDIELLISEW